MASSSSELPVQINLGWEVQESGGAVKSYASRRRGSGVSWRTKAVCASMAACLVFGTVAVVSSSAATKKKTAPKLTSVSLTLDNNIPAGGALNPFLTTWINTVERQSKNKIKITEYAQNVLYSNVASVAALQSNELNMSFVDVGSITDALPQFGAFELPIPGISDKQLQEYSGPGTSLFTLEEKYLQNHGLYVVPTPSFLPSSQSMLLKSPITSLSQLSGQKIRSIGGAMDSLLTGLGASPVDMTSGQVPTALQTGAITGAIGSLGVMSTTWAGLGDEDVDLGNLIPGIYWLVFSKAEWGKISVADRNFLTSTFLSEFNSYAPLAASLETNQESQWLAISGNTIYRPTAAENTQIAGIAKSTWASFQTSYPSVYKAAVATLKKYKISSPVTP
jgi:TRAP-type C4-dicarboxylate transport system substrate-binding protein